MMPQSRQQFPLLGQYRRCLQSQRHERSLRHLHPALPNRANRQMFHEPLHLFLPLHRMRMMPMTTMIRIDIPHLSTAFRLLTYRLDKCQSWHLHGRKLRSQICTVRLCSLHVSLPLHHQSALHHHRRHPHRHYQNPRDSPQTAKPCLGARWINPAKAASKPSWRQSLT